MTGVYGKRTKFQQKDVAQLLLKVSNDNLENNNHSIRLDKSIKWDYSNKDMDLKYIPKVFEKKIKFVYTNKLFVYFQIE